MVVQWLEAMKFWKNKAFKRLLGCWIRSATLNQNSKYFYKIWKLTIAFASIKERIKLRQLNAKKMNFFIRWRQYVIKIKKFESYLDQMKITKSNAIISKSFRVWIACKNRLEAKEIMELNASKYILRISLDKCFVKWKGNWLKLRLIAKRSRNFAFKSSIPKMFGIWYQKSLICKNVYGLIPKRLKGLIPLRHNNLEIAFKSIETYKRLDISFRKWIEKYSLKEIRLKQSLELKKKLNVKTKKNLFILWRNLTLKKLIIANQLKIYQKRNISISRKHFQAWTLKLALNLSSSKHIARRVRKNAKFYLKHWKLKAFYPLADQYRNQILLTTTIKFWNFERMKIISINPIIRQLKQKRLKSILKTFFLKLRTKLQLYTSMLQIAIDSNHRSLKSHFLKIWKMNRLKSSDQLYLSQQTHMFKLKKIFFERWVSSIKNHRLMVIVTIYNF
jgi:hypothetical protein